MDIPAGWALIFFNKSGISVKFGLVVGAQVIDHAYQGEIHMNVINTNNENPVYIEEGDKLVQGILLPIGLHPLEEATLEEMFQEEEMIPSTRGDGGFGSTGMDVLAVEPSSNKNPDKEWKENKK
jgi:dUTPase